MNKAFLWCVGLCVLLQTASCSRDKAGPVQPPAGTRQEAKPARRPAPLVADAAKLTRTLVTPHLEASIPGGKNVLWCGTFQLAWNELARLNGGPVRVQGPSKDVDTLNRPAVGRGDLDEGSLVAAAGLVADGVIEQIEARLKANFAGTATPRLVPVRADWPDDAVILYAYLRKAMPFAVPFEQGDSMVFLARRSQDGNSIASAPSPPLVRAFGIDEYSPFDPNKVAMGEQVRVLWHRFGDPEGGPEEFLRQRFIVELKTTFARERLILAKVDPNATLAQTLVAVQRHIATPNTKTRTWKRPADPNEVPDYLRQIQSLSSENVDGLTLEQKKKRVTDAFAAVSSYACLLLDEELSVPELNFDLTAAFEPLIGLSLASGDKKLDGKPIADARQRIGFRLDRHGAEVESEAFGGIFGGAAIREFAFYEPFLILLLDSKSSKPLLAMWIGNEELLVPAPDLDPPGADPATRPDP